MVEAAREREERWKTLEQLDEWLRTPMLVLAVAWLGIVLWELVRGGHAALELFGYSRADLLRLNAGDLYINRADRTRFREEVERTFAFMPAAQGVVKWPSAAPSLTSLVHETLLPLPDASVDRVLAVHALEMTVHGPDLLREVWRVLASGGKLLLVVPNRRDGGASEKAPRIKIRWRTRSPSPRAVREKLAASG